MSPKSPASSPFTRKGHAPSCPAPVQQAARATIRDFCEWWLSDEQREAWNVRTVIDGWQGEDRNADALFKCIHRDVDIAVFLILCQHNKRYPHYQLYVPQRGPLPQIITNSPLLAEVEKAMAECDQRMKGFRHKRKKSIALERGLSETDRRAIRDAIAALVQGLRDVYSRVMLPERRRGTAPKER